MNISLQNSPKISVIMPVYNAGKYLKYSIESILNQSFTNFEFFIIDDKSTDNSLEIIKSFKDERIILFEKKINTGYTNSLNMAIDLAKGEFIARMDADDISHKYRFAKQLAFMENNHDVVLLGSNYKYIGSERVLTYPASHEEIKVFSLTQNPVPHPTAFIRASVLKDFKLYYDKSFEPAEDYELWTQIMKLGKIANLQEVLLEYRVHDGQVSSIKSEIQKKSADKTRLKQLSELVDLSTLKIDISLILNTLTKKASRISAIQLLDLKITIEALYYANLNKKIYDEKLLFLFLRSIWEKYAYSVFNYRVSALKSILFQRNNITKMSLIFKIKFLIKCLIKKND